MIRHLSCRMMGLWLIITLLLLAPVSSRADVELVQVWPEKIWQKPDEPVKGTITLKNTAKEAVTVTVEAWLLSGIDTVKGRHSKTVTLEPESERSVAFRWKPKDASLFGQAMRARVSLDGKVIAEKEDYFSISRNYWDVCLLKTNPVLTATRSKESWGSEALNLRKNYFNGFEIFFWAPCDFADMTPEKEIWKGGQARYHESKTNLKYFIDEGHKHGLAFITYGKGIGGGPESLEYFRKRPENARGFGGRLAFSHRSYEYSHWDSDEYFKLAAYFYPNFDDPKVVNHGIDEIIGTTDMFGWDGIRFDGHFTVKSDEGTAEIDRLMKKRVWKKYPDYAFGYNFGLVDKSALDAALQRMPLETKALCAGGGLIMNEWIRSAGKGPAHPWNNWGVFSDVVLQDVEIVKSLGGYYCAVTDVNTNPYRSVFSYAAGAHPYYYSHFRPFAIRYCEFFWDRKLQRIADPAKVVNAPDALWWKKWVHLRPINRRHQQLVVHLIVPPPTEGVVDKDYTMPPPVRDVTVTLDAGTLKGNWKIERVSFLDPNSVSANEIPLASTGKSSGKVVVPNINVWGILVIDLEQ